MLTAYAKGGTADPFIPPGDTALGLALWIDLFNPTAEEIKSAEMVLGIELPSRQEAEEIETSSRLYADKGSLVMIATVMVRTTSPQPAMTPITFIFQKDRLVTMRFDDPTPFATFPRKLRKTAEHYDTAQKMLLGILDEIIDRAADVLETVGVDLTRISDIVFSEHTTGVGRNRTDLNAILTRLGQNGLRAANTRESMVSLARLLAFFPEAHRVCNGEILEEHWRAVGLDIASLTDHATFLSNKVNFFLDATLGRINSEQNTIIKLFSVLAVVFLPPTLIASVYGMNFQHMPELRWAAGYPVSLIVMLAAAIVPYFLFKRKGWL